MRNQDKSGPAISQPIIDSEAAVIGQIAEYESHGFLYSRKDKVRHKRSEFRQRQRNWAAARKAGPVAMELLRQSERDAGIVPRCGPPKPDHRPLPKKRIYRHGNGSNGFYALEQAAAGGRTTQHNRRHRNHALERQIFYTWQEAQENKAAGLPWARQADIAEAFINTETGEPFTQGAISKIIKRHRAMRAVCSEQRDTPCGFKADCPDLFQPVRFIPEQITIIPILQERGEGERYVCECMGFRNLGICVHTAIAANPLPPITPKMPLPGERCRGLVRRFDEARRDWYKGRCEVVGCRSHHKQYLGDRVKRRMPRRRDNPVKMT